VKAYLGDAVYADFDGSNLVLTTEDGIRETNRICLEPAVYKALTQYVALLHVRAARLDDDTRDLAELFQALVSGKELG